MERLRKKLNSRRGASILIALLFLLVCMMVAASVLMAAASNAGKLKSNRDEQQNYLTLSSAVNLIVDELENTVYTGRYNVLTSKRTMQERHEMVNEEGEAVWSDWETKEEKTVYTYEQIEGTLACSATSGLDVLLKDILLDELDTQFAGTMKMFKPGVGTLTVTPSASDRTLTVEVENDPKPDRVVKVKVVMRSDYGITLNASLEDDGLTYTMRAELIRVAAPTVVAPVVPAGASAYEWMDWTASFPPEDPPPSVANGAEIRITYSRPADKKVYPGAGETNTQVTWKLRRIQKGVAGG